MSVRTRFAPSPTGFLHLGGARTALYNWLYARQNGGQFVLRVEDTDAQRSTAESMQVIMNGLSWLGLDWDEGPRPGDSPGLYHQSQRTEIHDRYFAILEEKGLVYEDEGAIRFRVPDKIITVHDEVCGEVSVNLKEQGSRRYDAETKQEVEANPDFVIKRPNGDYIFHFVNVVDDIEMQISHIIRGEDHLSNTPKHLALFEAFDAEPPTFAHIPLNLNPSGSKMSKRDQGALIHEYEEAGFLPEAVNNYMALLGWSPKDDQEIFTIDELQKRFALSAINKSNSKFDYDKCKWVNGEHLRQLSPEELGSRSAPFLTQAGIKSDDSRVPAALELARDRASLLSEVAPVIAPIFFDENSFDPAAVEKLKQRENIGELIGEMAAAFESVKDWTETEIKAALAELAERKEIKLGALMQPCRVAATGAMSGADLMPMLELIGPEKVARRARELATLLS